MVVGEPPWRAGEVLRLLELELLEYRRLGTLITVADDLAPRRATDTRTEVIEAERSKGSPWRRYTAAEVARIAVIVGVCGGRDAYSRTTSGIRRRPVRLQDVTAAGRALKERYGAADPLLEVMWLRQGREILVIHRGALLNPVTNQVVVSLGLPMPSFLAEVAARGGAELSAKLLGPLRFVERAGSTDLGPSL